MEKTKFSIKTYLEYINENKDEKLFNQLLTESYDMTKDQEILVDMEIDRIVETFKDKDLNLLTNEDIDKIINEGFIGSLVGGLVGFSLGKAIGKLIAKILGIEKGILYDMLTSRLVGAALGAALGKGKEVDTVEATK